MSIDTSEFDKVVPERKSTCWHSRMTDEQRDKVAAAREKGHSSATIARVVTSWGYSIQDNAVRRHCQGNCACPK